ncbi:MAG: hypothetical protein A3C43_03135 [Candidatus Schekmanbacteria bacterium RIFCSPHIGHO2_02_FULL_38_11]|uniref:Lipoprotein n=1 Tax=Candidatus Schekmanbacteria bacterium RIFCSPLOWO2_12_FULL_38_15 TaxID=1817883 RepID=A0A1F7SEC1_9BACT|nr:MAG: hypothetical protein A3H37_10390 [Candidatus Schekmanbacteria bacterium RIFCSPLOWO2_02_FULL_38_14]OGL52133.1 MAG: hypothetical protein A3G31_06860 [Candidatus Schekmanbacteria bacterium RIFCSPLOWO2_12_FULL_38_15]OGL53611.1 MAG: hypothetical protein A3C43_03135 [Candidatus Schekmanbacteria bacterium RIFCSPHIGHO2_02_FULL_38_11]
MSVFKISSKFLFFLFIIISCIGCMSFNYKPDLSLGLSSETIQAKVQIEEFIDETPQGDHSKKIGGTSCTSADTLEGSLTVGITNAVMKAFYESQVFDIITRRIDNPDLILRGKIHRFYGKAGPNALFWCTIPIDPIWLFGVPVLSNEGEVDIEISLFSPKRELISSYRQMTEFSGLYTMYNNPTFGIGTQLNNAFNKVISEIRDKILLDKNKLERSN